MTSCPLVPAARPRFLRGRFAVLLLAALLPGAARAQQISPEGIVPHRAAYELKLTAARPSSGVTSADGAMVVEWDASCDGWTVRQRIVLSLSNNRGDTLETDTSFSSWERFDGTEYSFNVRTLRDSQLDEELRGMVDRRADGEGALAVYSLPEGKTVSLAEGTMFPTRHTLELIEAAKKGEKQFFRTVFDGATEEGQSNLNALIGQPLEPAAGLPPSPLLEAAGWHMRLAFFDPASEEWIPDYELGVELLDNGVARALDMDYGDFVIRARLDRLEPLPQPTCR